MKKVKENFIIGILGGMGPYASIELQKRIVSMTPVKTESDHIKMICFTNPKIKDRTECIKNGESFSKEIIRSLKVMENIKVDFGVIACNTAHVEFEKIQQNISFPLINIIKETIDFISSKFPETKKVGILATDGTIISGLYKKYCEKQNMKVIYPSLESQKIVMEIIYGKYGIKKGKISNKLNFLVLKKLINEFNKTEIDLVILGCTELSIYKFNDNKIIDPISIVSEKVIKKATD